MRDEGVGCGVGGGGRTKHCSRSYSRLACLSSWDISLAFTPRPHNSQHKKILFPRAGIFGKSIHYSTNVRLRVPLS